MADPAGASESAYADLLAALWDEFEELLDSLYGRRAMSPDGIDRLRLKVREMRHRLLHLMDQAEPRVASGSLRAQQLASLRRLTAELLRLLDPERLDEDFDLCCGTTMVRAQNCILDEAQRLARAR
jgi:hypothetical protein